MQAGAAPNAAFPSPRVLPMTDPALPFTESPAFGGFMLLPGFAGAALLAG
jgi:hypothetical protein